MTIKQITEILEKYNDGYSTDTMAASAIHALYEKERKELLAKVRGMKIKRDDKGCYDRGDDGNIYIVNCEYGNCSHYGYNTALSDVERLLTNEESV